MLRSEPFKELSEDRLSEALAAPHNRVRIMVDDHGYILVAFLVAGLINTNVVPPLTGRSLLSMMDQQMPFL